MSRGVPATKLSRFRVPKGWSLWKATAWRSQKKIGRERHAPGGVVGRGASEEDDPETWEALPPSTSMTRPNGEPVKPIPTRDAGKRIRSQSKPSHGASQRNTVSVSR